jgi:uncharacterized damage-inducible protein DinB
MSTAAVMPEPVSTLYPDMEAELATTRRMLERVPIEQGDWKPHGKSMSLLALASHVAQLPAFAAIIASTEVLHFNPADFGQPSLSSTADLLALFDEKAAVMRAAFAALDAERLAGTWKMMMGEHTFVEGQRAALLRTMGINHLVHHRAQLGVYLRLLDVKIPGSYGPSADTNAS